jgi:hypothetical protein
VQHFEQNSKHKCSEKTENKNGLQYNQLSTTVTSLLANIKLLKAGFVEIHGEIEFNTIS